MSSVRMQLCFGSWIAALTAVFYLLPQYSMYSWAAIGVSAAAVVLLGIRWHHPDRKLPWYLLAAVLASFTAGDTTYNILTDVLGWQNPFPSIADVFYLSVYPMLAGALLVFIRARSGSDNRAALLDALVPTAGLGLLSWVFLISPDVRDSELTLFDQLVSVSYPLGDVLALAMLARLLTARGRRPYALTVLAIGVTSLLITDVLYGLRQLDGWWHVGGPIDAGWVLFYAATALSASHPSMRQLTVKQLGTIRASTGGRRIAAMSVAALIAPTLLLIEDMGGGVQDAPMIAIASALMFAAVMIRVAGLMRDQRDTGARERTLRITGTELVAATSEKAAAEALRKAVVDLVPAGEPYRFYLCGSDLPSTEPVQQRRPGRVAVADQVPTVVAALAGFEQALLAEIVIVGRIPGALPRRKQAYFAARPHLLSALQQAFETLMAQGTLAIERINLTDEVTRRSSEDYFRALIQSASDVILIVSDDETIRYASPSAVPVFGAGELVGTGLGEVIAASDHEQLHRLLADVRAGRGPRDGVDLTAVRADQVPLQVECTCRDLRGDPAVGGLVVTIRDVTERRRLQNDLVHQAFHDGLTGLANRARFQSRLEQAALLAARTQTQVGVLFIDLDDFKEVNDTLGHGVGDRLLISVGERISAAVGPLNTVARTGGDEFAVLVEQVLAPDEAEQIAHRIVAALNDPFEVSDSAGGYHLVRGAGSVGVAISGDADGIGELLQRADVAMYAAKVDGKNTWQRYRDDLHIVMVRRLEMRAALNEAVAGEQMRLRFQPIVDLSTLEITAVEALVRWEHPSFGLLGPAEFIELSEENGSIVAIGGWVLREALRTFAQWADTVPESPLRYVSVNVSARQFRTPGFVDQVRAALAATGVQPSQLLLEITESLVLRDAEQVWSDLRELRAMGIRIAIDDFGTGYSSLSYLRQMPVDVLKIDKSFIDDISHSEQQLALVEHIVNLARTLELTVVAEGIELVEQRAALGQMGCPYGQGYLFAEPATADEVSQWLQPSYTALPR